MPPTKNGLVADGPASAAALETPSNQPIVVRVHEVKAPGDLMRFGSITGRILEDGSHTGEFPLVCRFPAEQTFRGQRPPTTYLA
jgi:hypothetical protein